MVKISGHSDDIVLIKQGGEAFEFYIHNDEKNYLALFGAGGGCVVVKCVFGDNGWQFIGQNDRYAVSTKIQDNGDETLEVSMHCVRAEFWDKPQGFSSDILEEMITDAIDWAGESVIREVWDVLKDRIDNNNYCVNFK